MASTATPASSPTPATAAKQPAITPDAPTAPDSGDRAPSGSPGPVAMSTKPAPATDDADPAAAGATDADTAASPASKPSTKRKRAAGSGKRGGGAKKPRKKKDKDAPKRGLSSYLFFTQAKRPELMKEHPEWKIGQLGSHMGKLWKALTDEEKAPFIKLAAADKERAAKEKAAYAVVLAAREAEAKKQAEEAAAAAPVAQTPSPTKAKKAKSTGSASKSKGSATKAIRTGRSAITSFFKSAPGASPAIAAPLRGPSAAARRAVASNDGATATTEPAARESQSLAGERKTNRAPAKVAPKATKAPKVAPKVAPKATKATKAVAADSGSDSDSDEEMVVAPKRGRRRAVVDSDSDSSGDEDEGEADATAPADADGDVTMPPSTGAGGDAGAGAASTPKDAEVSTTKAKDEDDGDATEPEDEDEDEDEDEGDNATDEEEEGSGKQEEAEEEAQAEVTTKPKAKATAGTFSAFFGGAGKSESGSKKSGASSAETEAALLKLFVSGKTGKFNPEKRATWAKGAPVPYEALANVFYAIESTTKRLEIQDMLCNFFRCVIVTTPGDLIPVVNMAANRLAPAFAGVEIGIGDSIMIKAIVECTGRTTRDVKAEVHTLGDLGLVAEASKSTQSVLFTPARLTVRKVFNNLLKIAKMSGNKSQTQKLVSIRKMMVACKGKESRYLVRGLQGKLRIGLAERTVLVALAHAVALTPPTASPPVLDLRTTMPPEKVTAAIEAAEAAVKQAHSEMPSYDEILPALLRGGIEEMTKTCTLRPGVPVSPMLAKPTHGVSEVLDRFTNIRFVCEWKYDGERGQIHCLPDGTIKLFSRNSEDSTPKFPDVASMISSACNEDTKTFVLDGEIVAYDREQGALLPFQQLSTRARKGATLENITTQVVYVVFDILYLNGKSLLHETLETRKRLLNESFHEVKGRFEFARSLQCSDLDEIQSFLKLAVAGNCEGLMVKTLVDNSTYEPTRRSLNWLKLKQDYIDGLADSFDLVPIAAYLGKGKRTGVYGAYLLATYSEDDEEFQAITKVGTGFSDEVLQSHTKFFQEKELVRDTKPMNVQVGNVQKPDVWLEPGTVWEVKAADLSISPVYRAAFGMVDPRKGIALRFPRFIRVRTDKDPEGCTNAEQVAQMYRDQGLAVASNKKRVAANDDL